MSFQRLLEIHQITGKISVLTGLMIGAGNDEIRIGGVDNPIIRNPATNEPYIPGSSLKGKIRSLLELATGRISNGNPWATTDSTDPIARIFGNGNPSEDKFNGGPTRISFRDCPVINGKQHSREKTLVEKKAEIVMDRIKGKVATIGPRQMERVCSGVQFDFNVAYKVFDFGDNGALDKKHLKLVLLGLKLLERDALGGSGSRGYGRIKFEEIKITPVIDQLDWDNLNLSELENSEWQYRASAKA